MGGVQCEIVFSALLLHLSSKMLRFISRTGYDEIDEFLCYYFWNSLGDYINLGIPIPKLLQKKLHKSSKIEPSHALLDVKCSFFADVKKTEGLRILSHTEHSP